MDGLSLNITEDNLARLRQLFPDAFTEGKVDFDRLRAALGDAGALAAPNHYELSWAGKADARREVQRQTGATLVPDRARSVDFDTTQNVFIEGENLEVLRVLQHAYHGQVKMIYIDPPYNTGNDSFVYPDDYSERKDDYLKRAGHTDDAGFLNKQDLWQKNSKESGQYHSAWLSMMWPRLYLSRNLLREDGVIFVSIDDNEVHNLRMLMNEVFGEENFVGEVVWKSRRSEDTRAKTGLSTDHEYIIAYRKSPAAVLRGVEKDLQKFSNPDNDTRGPWRSADLTGLATREQRPNLHYELVDPSTGTVYQVPFKGWRYERATMNKKISEGRILFPLEESGRPRHKLFLNETNSLYKTLSSVVTDITTAEGGKEVDELVGAGVFSFPKPVSLAKLLLSQLSSDTDNDLILDFFAGSGTTAQAVMELNQQDGGNRRFIVVQMPEVVEENTEAHKAGYRTIADITQARIRKAGEKIKAAGAGKLALDGGTDALDLGFRAYRLEYSNFKPWRADVPDAAAVLSQLELFQEPLKDYSDAASAAMLTELLLKAGQPLDTPVAVRKVGEATVHVVGAGGELWLALSAIDDAVVVAAAAAKPARLVVPGRLFGPTRPDEAINNARLTLEDAGVELQLI